MHTYLFWYHKLQKVYIILACNDICIHYTMTVGVHIFYKWCSFATVSCCVFFFLLLLRVYTIWVGVISLHYGSAVLCWYSLAVHNSWRRHFYAHTSWSKTWISDKEVVSWVMLNKRMCALHKLIYFLVLVLILKIQYKNANKQN